MYIFTSFYKRSQVLCNLSQIITHFFLLKFVNLQPPIKAKFQLVTLTKVTLPLPAKQDFLPQVLNFHGFQPSQPPIFFRHPCKMPKKYQNSLIFQKTFQTPSTKSSKSWWEWGRMRGSP